MQYNGTAIKGGCVTRRKHRADPGTLASFARRNDFSREGGKIVTVSGGYGACFCRLCPPKPWRRRARYKFY